MFSLRTWWPCASGKLTWQSRQTDIHHQKPVNDPCQTRPSTPYCDWHTICLREFEPHNLRSSVAASVADVLVIVERESIGLKYIHRIVLICVDTELDSR